MDEAVREHTPGGVNPLEMLSPMGAGLEIARAGLNAMGLGQVAQHVPTQSNIQRGVVEGITDSIDGVSQAVSNPGAVVQGLSQSSQSNPALDTLDPSGRASDILAMVPNGQALNVATNMVQGAFNDAMQAEKEIGPGGGIGQFLGSMATPMGLPGAGAKAASVVARASLRHSLGPEQFNSALSVTENLSQMAGSARQRVREAFTPASQRELAQNAKNLTTGRSIDPGGIQNFLDNPQNMATLRELDARGSSMAMPPSMQGHIQGPVFEGRENVLRELERRQNLPADDPDHLDAGTAARFVDGMMQNGDLNVRPMLFETTPTMQVGRGYTADNQLRQTMGLNSAGPLGGYYSPLESFEGRSVGDLRRENDGALSESSSEPGRRSRAAPAIFLRAQRSRASESLI